MKLWIKNSENMYSNFDYNKIEPQYHFFKCVRLLFFSRLLEIKKFIGGVKCRF